MRQIMLHRPFEISKIDVKKSTVVWCAVSTMGMLLEILVHVSN